MQTMTVSRVQRVRLVTAVALAILLLGVALVLRSEGASRGKTGAEVLGEQIFGASPKGTPTTPPTPSQLFSASGSMVGLYPGGAVPLTLTLTNTTGSAIKVTALYIAVGDASSACAGANLHIGTFNGPVAVEKKSSTTTVIDLTLDRDAPNACQGLTFPLTYSGDAQPA